MDGAGRRVEHRTLDPTSLLHELTGQALARGQRLHKLSVTRPSLEEVYLELTGEHAAGSETAMEMGPLERATEAGGPPATTDPDSPTRVTADA